MKIEQSEEQNFAGRLRTSLYWWLGYRRPFLINDEYKLELLHIDREHQSVKIRITNLKTNEVSSAELPND